MVWGRCQSWSAGRHRRLDLHDGWKSNWTEFKIQLHTVGSTLGSGLLAATAADTHTVDDIALLGLVTEAAGLVGTGGARGAVDDVQLTKLY